MKLGQATICYQHQEAQNSLEKLLNIYSGMETTTYLCNNLKDAIVWINEANESAVRMENKLKYYKELMKKYEGD